MKTGEACDKLQGWIDSDDLQGEVSACCGWPTMKQGLPLGNGYLADVGE